MSFIRLILLATLLALATACSGGCAGTLGGIPAASDIAMIPVDPEEQQRIAIHEMAHAVAALILFGDDDVNHVHVHVERCPPAEFDPELCCDILEKSHYGSMNRVPDGLFTLGSVENSRKKVVLYLIGPVSDRLLSGIDPEKYDGIDMRNVDANIEDVLHRLRMRARTGGRYPYADRPHVPASSAEKEFARATAYAEAIVRANEGAIRELADRLMATKPRYGRRDMSAEAFERVVRDLNIVDPHKKTAKKASRRK